MSVCPLKLNADGFYECPNCKWVFKLKASKPPRRFCPKSPDHTEAAEKLGITGDAIKHWAHALARWTAAGFPVRSQAEVEQLLRICVRCENYVPDNPKCTGEVCRMKTGGSCKLCGCRVSRSRMAVVNKLKMATEDCPKGHWAPLSDSKPSDV